MFSNESTRHLAYLAYVLVLVILIVIAAVQGNWPQVAIYVALLGAPVLAAQNTSGGM